ncbi:hypothetical protein, partial [Streptosporangium sp. NPDC049644]
EATLLLQEAQVCATLSLTYAIVQASASTHRDEKEWINATDVSLDEPGQVEPAPTGVRVIHVARDAMVMYPEWNGGDPVRILNVEGTIKTGMVAVRYTFPGARDGEELAVVPADTLVTPYGGAA